MSDPAIRITGLSKLYKIGALQERPSSLREAVGNMVKYPARRFKTLSRSLFTSDDQALGQATAHDDFIWALRDIEFDVDRGQVIGIIGHNGAGKSTLLKILTRITAPTQGRIELNGRVASLLEVGTGFHPELSGRENIFLNGAILGMSRSEIRRHFDEIVAFSSIEKFIDTPVKRYSSGMYVRLAFAVAAHLEPEIMLVDEVLAVGDHAFQQKCMGKMDDIAREGRTILFVSHNMGMINRLCSRALLLNGGQMVADGDTETVTDTYINSLNRADGARDDDARLADDQEVAVLQVYTVDDQGKHTNSFTHDAKITGRIRFATRHPGETIISVAVCDFMQRKVFTSRTAVPVEPRKADGDAYTASMEIPVHLLTPGAYTFIAGIVQPDGDILDVQRFVGGFRIVDAGSEFARFEGKDYGVVFADCGWSFEKESS